MKAELTLLESIINYHLSKGRVIEFAPIVDKPHIAITIHNFKERERIEVHKKANIFDALKVLELRLSN